MYNLKKAILASVLQNLTIIDGEKDPFGFLEEDLFLLGIRKYDWIVLLPLNLIAVQMLVTTVSKFSFSIRGTPLIINSLDLAIRSN